MAADRLTSFSWSSQKRAARRGWMAMMVAAALAAVSSHASADVSSSGDVSPAISPAPTVDLTGQRIFIGNTSGGVGGFGTLNVTSGGSLTAAGIIQGTGGLGIGVANVTGAGSVIHLTGGGAFNGLDIGSWGTGTMTVSSGGAVVCSSPLACPFNIIADAAGSSGTLTLNGGSVTGLGTLSVGQGSLGPGFGTAGANTTATLTIAGGGVLATTGTSAVANNFGQTGTVTGNVTINGAGSSWNITRDLANGGGQAGLQLARTANSNASMTLSNGGNLTISGSRSNPAGDDSLPFINVGSGAGGTATMTVTSGSSIVLAGDTGAINVGSNPSAAAGTGTLNITGGGTVSGTGSNGLVFMGIGRNLGTGTVNVSGAGSQLVLAGVGGVNTQGLDGIGGLLVVGRNQGVGGGTGALNVTAGGLVSVSDNGLVASTGVVALRVAQGTGTTGSVTVSGAGSSIVVSSTSGDAATTPRIEIGDGGIGQMSIANGGSVSVLGSAAQRNFIVGNSTTGSGSLSMTNNSTMNASWFAIGNVGGTGVATIDHSTVNLDGVVFFNGDPIGAGLRVGRGVGSNGTLTLQNGAVINLDNTIASSNVILGGTSSLAGGNGTLNMSGGSAINFTGSAASASLQVGGVSGSGAMSMTGGSTANVGATGSVQVAATAGSSGNLSMSGGSVVTGNVIGIGGSSDTDAGGVGSASVTGAGTVLRATGDNGFIGVGRGGIGTLVVSNLATLEATIVNVGRATGGIGTWIVDNATVALSGQQAGGTGAGIGIGVRGGSGTATIGNGSQVTITNPGTGGVGLNIGGSQPNPLGTGTLTVSGGSQITLAALPGKAAVRVGHDGTGTAIFSGSTLNVAGGSVLVGELPGSTGTLTLNAGSVVNTSYVGVGASQAGPGGSGHLIVNDSTVNTDTFELGAGGILSGNNGTIHATGDVIVGGTISPGNSPGRLIIHCNIISLDGSMLILDVEGVGEGFDVDKLVIGNDSTFDLHHIGIVFNFLGDTDPEAFAASGGFDLDNFLRTEVPGGDVGLSAAFAPGETWSDVVDPTKISAVSSMFDVTGLHLEADGSVVVTTAPIPEPSTWAMLVGGLLLLQGWARRRTAGALRAAARHRLAA